MIEVFVDGACYNPVKSVGGDIYAGIVITKDKKVIKRIGKPIGKGHSSNAESISVLEALRNIPDEYIEEEVCIYCDSQTVVAKISRYLPREINLEAIKLLEQNSELLCEIIKRMREFKGINIKWIDRNQNTMAHNLAQGTANGFQENLIDIDLINKCSSSISSLSNLISSKAPGMEKSIVYESVEDLLNLNIGQLINTIVAQKADNCRLMEEMKNLKNKYKQLEDTVHMIQMERECFYTEPKEDNVIEVKFNRFLC